MAASGGAGRCLLLCPPVRSRWGRPLPSPLPPPVVALVTRGGREAGSAPHPPPVVPQPRGAQAPRQASPGMHTRAKLPKSCPSGPGVGPGRPLQQGPGDCFPEAPRRRAGPTATGRPGLTACRAQGSGGAPGCLLRPPNFASWKARTLRPTAFPGAYFCRDEKMSRGPPDRPGKSIFRPPKTPWPLSWVG